MTMFDDALMADIRARFHHVDRCPYQGARIFFENAGGSLTLKSVSEVTAELAAIPDNQGRDNPASAAMMQLIHRGRADMALFLGVDGDGDGNGDGGDGVIFVGETGTECLFRVIRAAVLAAARDGDGRGGDNWQVLGSTLEHPATASAARRWAAQAGAHYTAVAHDPATGTVDADAYRAHLSADTRVATVIHTSPVTGMAVDVAAVAAAIREASPDAFIIVDGIQHAPHGGVAVADYGVDAYAVSGYKVFSRHNYGFAWVSPRLSVAPHDRLDGTADDAWELGTRDAGAYATFSAVVDYFDWLGGRADAAAGDSSDRRARITAAARAIAAHEHGLTDLMLNGGGDQPGLAALPGITVIGGAGNERREGVVSLAVDGVPAAAVVRQLSAHGVRVHTRKNDYFSANILDPLGLETCVRVSLAHYNSADEVQVFLRAMEAVTAAAAE